MGGLVWRVEGVGVGGGEEEVKIKTRQQQKALRCHRSKSMCLTLCSWFGEAEGFCILGQRQFRA